MHHHYLALILLSYRTQDYSSTSDTTHTVQLTWHPLTPDLASASVATAAHLGHWLCSHHWCRQTKISPDLLRQLRILKERITYIKKKINFLRMGNIITQGCRTLYSAILNVLKLKNNKGRDNWLRWDYHNVDYNYSQIVNSYFIPKNGLKTVPNMWS